MSKRLIFIISSLFLIQISVFSWSYWEQVYLIQKDKKQFESLFATTISDISIIDSLDLSGQNLREIPDYSERFKNLKHLNLSYNQLSKIPDWILALKLKTLNLSHNKLIEIPNFQNAEIDNLNLSFNEICFSSAAVNKSRIRMPKGLKILNLSDNKIEFLPSTLDLTLQPLEEINISIFKPSLERVIANNTRQFIYNIVEYDVPHISYNSAADYIDILPSKTTDTLFNHLRSNTKIEYNLKYIETDNILENHLLECWKIDSTNSMASESFYPSFEDSLVINKKDTFIIRTFDWFNSICYTGGLQIDNQFKRFIRLETLKFKNIKQSGKAVNNAFLKTLELKTKSKYLCLDFETRNLKMLIVNEYSLKAVLRGKSYCPFLEKLIIEKELNKNDDLAIDIQRFQKKYPKVKIRSF
jgi:hypothetical protein